MYNLRSQNQTDSSKLQEELPMDIPIPSISQVNPTNSHSFVHSFCRSPGSSKASSVRSSKHSLRELEVTYEKDLLKEELVASMRELEVSKLRVEEKRIAFEALQRRIQNGSTLDDELAPRPDARLPLYHQYTSQYFEEPDRLPPKEQSTVRSLIAASALPKLEIDKFDGNPRKFWKFMKGFQVNIADRVADDTQRLMYLIHYCTGEAKEAIEDCVLLAEDHGFTKAMHILHRQFGRPHDIAETFINSMVTGDNIHSDDIDSLRKLVREMTSCEIALTQMRYTADLNCSTNMKRIVSRLPKHLQREWAKVADDIIHDQQEPSFSQLIRFLERSLSAATNVYGRLASNGTYPSSSRMEASHQRSRLSRTHVNASVASDSNCPVCSGGHQLHTCEKFLVKSQEEKLHTLRENKLCFNCFKPNHRANECRSSSRCDKFGCGKRHNRLLHVDSFIQASNKSNARVNSQTTEVPSAFLGFIPVRLIGSRGAVECYALLDSGSDSTLIASDVADRIGLQGVPTELEVSSINGTSMKQSLAVSLTIESIKRDYRANVETAYVIDKLPLTKATTPSSEVLKRWPYLHDIKLSQIRSRTVSILIGTNVSDAHWVLSQRIGTGKQPYATLTVFGWVIFGHSGSSRGNTTAVNVLGVRESIESTMLRMFEMDFDDQKYQNVTPMSVEDERVLLNAQRSSTLKDGHYQVALPWKHDWHQIPVNRFMAEKRLQYLRRRLLKDDILLRRYTDIIADYETKGYISRVQVERLEGRRFIPHHPVFNAHKPGKVRIVFDCAAKTERLSLNDCLNSGPCLTNDLTGVLLRFRLHDIALSADIEEMFLQVHLRPEDKLPLSFLWYADGNLNTQPEVYELNVHPFGATSSPFCAAFALRQVAYDNRESVDEQTVAAVEKNFYVDDCLVSVGSAPEAFKLVEQLTYLLSQGGFRLHKWISNNEEVSSRIPISERARDLVPLNSSPPDMHKTLGLFWCVKSDAFKFKVALPERPVTKRGILSCAASLYDPLGYVAPLLLVPKQIMQRLCRSKCGWDEVVDEPIQAAWVKWKNDIRMVESIQIPRCIKPPGFLSESQSLHIFSDASEAGYGTVAYLRCETTTQVSCRFLMGKSRVAPLKPVTIPRLELQAAVLSVRLMCHLRKQLETHFDAVYCWTDSTIVLHYIFNTRSRFKTFVANRIGFIHENTDTRQWRHVPGDLNPADYASRGIFARNANALDAWIRGPEFLRSAEPEWPNINFEATQIDATDVELKKNAAVFSSATKNLPIDSLLSHYSSWTKLRRAVAWFVRFKSYLYAKRFLSDKEGVNRDALQLREMNEAEVYILRYIQQKTFPNEVDKSQNSETAPTSKQLLKGSHLYKLSPVMLGGLLCVGGRLTNSTLPEAAKHPIILPGDHPVVTALINFYHEMEGHMGVSHVLAVMRKRYWILRGATTVKRIINKCIGCKMRSAVPVEQLMADLPLARVEPGYPFSSTGVDYFGPFQTREGRSTRKRYGCIFTCLKTRAVHLEVAHYLTVDSFLMALSRFINRRGCPKEIYSDRGSNFVGAELELRNFVRSLDCEHVQREMIRKEIVWKFNPPYSSHRGGIWERIIRSIRRILSAVSREQTLSEESLRTYLTEVERILNNRPLVPVRDDPDDTDVLTPNHLLLPQGPFVMVEEIDGLRYRYTRQWRQSQLMAHTFWHRWLKEYVPILQSRQRWAIPRRNIQVNDLVLLVGEQHARGAWSKGIVTSVVAGSDGRVRTVEVKTHGNVVTRDIRKVCLLEGADER